MPVLHNGVMRRTTAEDVIEFLEATQRTASRRLDCLAWDALGYCLMPGEGDSWPRWQDAHSREHNCTVPEFSVDLHSVLEEVHRQGGEPAEFMDSLMAVLREDESLTGTEFMRVLPIAALTLCVVRYGGR